MIRASVASAEPGPVKRNGPWQVRDPGAILVREWDGEVVVYNANAASTHLLSPAAGVIFMVLLESARPMADGELAALVIDDSGSGPATRAPAAASENEDGRAALHGDFSDLRAVLDDLDRIGLVEQVGA